MFIDPWGLKAENLREMAEASGGIVDWCEKTRTATVTINGVTRTFTEGEAGIYIDQDGVLMVEGALFAHEFEGQYWELTGDGFVEYQLFIEMSDMEYFLGVPISGTTHKINVTSITYLDNVAGQRAAQKANDHMDNLTATATLVIWTGVGALGGPFTAVAGFTYALVEIWLIDYSHGLNAGDTIITSSIYTFSKKGLLNDGRGRYDYSLTIKRNNGDTERTNNSLTFSGRL